MEEDIKEALGYEVKFSGINKLLTFTFKNFDIIVFDEFQNSGGITSPACGRSLSCMKRREET